MAAENHCLDNERFFVQGIERASQATAEWKIALEKSLESTKVNCWKCEKLLGEGPVQIGYRSQCPYCDADLHVCLNCRFYMPGKPNDCSVPGTDWIKERDRMNLCDEFDVKKEVPRIPSSKNQARKNFDSLFKNEKDE